MDDGYDHDAIGFDLIDDEVREPPDHRPPDIRQDSWIEFRPCCDLIQRLLYPLGELRSEASALGLIPVKSCVEVGLCFDPERNGQRHMRALARA